MWRQNLIHVDDFTELLSFYNYSLDETSQNKEQLDSVIYKSTTGIVLHDLRNDWIDNLYLLTGAAYYLRKQFDSAYLTFQFINYAFAKKEKDGYYQTIGSKFDGNSALSISTKEKNSLPRKVFSEQPSRNDAFIWQIRTLIAMEEYAEAASLIITLKNDPEFPNRLKNDLEEVQAWWFYNGNMYDSAAVHLEKALSNATNKRERARWEFLVAQLYEKSGQLEVAKKYYDEVINHTIDRVLGSEKSESKKFTLPRRFTQNTFTHYNYFFNANNKLNQVLEEAKLVHVDDFTELLSFYNYSLDETSQNKEQLDSVIYKSTTGIVLHDLRNDWIDNLYLLTGAAYYLRKQFDSAYLTFQFINYAFAKKEKDGYYQTIGSKFDGNSALSISTKEKNSLPRKVFSEQPSRNDAFIWQIRTLIAMEEYAEAASLIITLKNDPEFPNRLKNDLEEVQAWWFYNGNMYDSAAVHLEKALSNATNKRERARWEFLVAQLYEKSGQLEVAKKYYDEVINHTIDPVMEIYARLHSIRINKAGGDNYIDRNITELLKMAKRDKYIDYRDVIYYTIGQMEIERNNFDKALANLTKKSTQNNIDNFFIKK